MRPCKKCTLPATHPAGYCPGHAPLPRPDVGNLPELMRLILQRRAGR